MKQVKQQDSLEVSMATFNHDLPNQMVLGASQALYTSLAVIVLKQHLQGSDWEVAAIHSAFMVGFLLSLFYVEWGKKHSPVPMVTFPQFIGRVLLFVLLWWQDSLIFTAVVCCGAFLNATTIPVISVIYQRNYPPEERGKIVGATKKWGLATAMMVAWLVGKMLDMYPPSFQWIYPGFALVGIATILWFHKIPSIAPKEIKPRRFRDIPKIFWEDRNFAIFMLFQFMFGFANLAGIAILHLYVNNDNYLSYSPSNAALLTGVLPPLAMMLTVKTWGKVFDQMNFIKFRAITMVVMALAFLLFAFAPTMEVLMLACLLWGFGKGGGNLAWTLGVFAFTNAEKAPLYLGINTFLTGVRGVIAPFLGVQLLHWGMHPQTYFLVASVVILLAAAMMISLIHLPERGQEKT